MDCGMPGFPVLHSLQEFAQTNVHWVIDAFQPSHPLLPLFPLALNLSQHQCWLFASGGQSIGASDHISPSNELSGMISLRIDWFDPVAVQRTLKSLLWHHTLKASILKHPDFFMVQILHCYLTTRKTIALTIWTFVAK